MAYNYPTQNAVDPVTADDDGVGAASPGPLQFGATYGVFCAALCAIILLALPYFFPAAPRSEEQIALIAWMAALIVTICSPAGGLAFVWLGRKAPQLGLVRATGLAAISGFCAAILLLSLHLVWSALPFEFRPLYPYPTFENFPVSIGAQMLLAASFGFLSARLLLPIYLVSAPTTARSPWMRILTLALALLLPAAALGVPAQYAARDLGLAALSQDVIQRDETIDLLIRQKGLATADDLSSLTHRHYAKPMFPAAVVARVEKALGLPVSGIRSEALGNALFAAPDKTHWILDGDGGGDATSMAELLAISWGDIQVAIRPGVYTPEPGIASAASPIDTLNIPDQPDGPLGAAPRGPLARALWEMAHMRMNNQPSEGVRAAARHTVRLAPDPDGGVMFVETQPLTVPANFVLEHATLKFELARGVSRLLHHDVDAALTLQPGARLMDVRILAPGPPAANVQGPGAAGPSAIGTPPPPIAALKAAALSDAASASTIQQSKPESKKSDGAGHGAADAVSVFDNVEILSDGEMLRTGILIEAPTIIANSRIGPMLNGCIEIVQPVKTILQDNDFSACGGIVQRIPPPAKAALIVIDNRKARRPEPPIFDAPNIRTARLR